MEEGTVRLAYDCGSGSQSVRSVDLWAKTDPTSDAWHSLPCHLLDVAAAATALWTRLPVSSRAVAVSVFGDEALAQRMVAFLAGAHDVGKANLYFQAKEERQRVRLGLDRREEPQRHGYASVCYLRSWLMSAWEWPAFEATHVAQAVGGHHGSFFADVEPSRLRLNEQPWILLGPELLNDLSTTMEVGRADPPQSLRAFLGWLAGFVSVADWLGSHEAMVGYVQSLEDPKGYLARAVDRAHGLLNEIRFFPPDETPAISLSELLPANANPNQLQEAAAVVALDGYSLAIVEAPTGEGKTEAAFALCEPSRAAGAGLYFALPTMATANGLYHRVREYLASRLEGTALDTRLLHSLAWLYREKVPLARNPGEEGLDHWMEAEDWFAGGKRGLIAPYSVGTIDQALIAALRTRHGFVRLFALAGKTVVFDEVHAYDVYMSDLLDTLLGWLRALGCRVILLSATLPRDRRCALMRAWGCDEPDEEPLYPCITWVDPLGKVRSQTVGVTPRKALRITRIKGDGRELWERGAESILSAVRADGGVGVLILNTVDAAQQAYRLLKARASDVELHLFHARFTAQDRENVEQRVLERFGKNRTGCEPAILVATQVVEQSLDLDFDHMVSALAPIDLLIQRAGRLHRHRRHKNGSISDGQDERPAPILKVLSLCEKDDGVPILEDPVYAGDIQLLTAQLLTNDLVIDSTSSIVAAIESVYGADIAESMPAVWRDAYDKFKARTEAERLSHHDKAADVRIPTVQGRKPITASPTYLREDDDTPGSQVAARTRLETLPTVSLVVLSAGEQVPSPAHPQGRRSLVLRTVRASAQGKRLEDLLDLPAMPGWSRTKALKEAHALTLQENGTLRTPNYLFSYDSEFGLSWRRSDG